MKIKTWQIRTIVICTILGIILHFTYEWSGENIIVGLFSAVNESTWEHLKLIFYPMVLMAVIGYFIIGKRSNNYWFAQSVGIITAMFFTIIFLIILFSSFILYTFNPPEIALFEEPISGRFGI